MAAPLYRASRATMPRCVAMDESGVTPSHSYPRSPASSLRSLAIYLPVTSSSRAAAVNASSSSVMPLLPVLLASSMTPPAMLPSISVMGD